MATKTEARAIKGSISVAARVAGEDLRRGDYVTVLNEVIELPSFLWCGREMELPAREAVRIQYLPLNPGVPYKVLSVCLPFVYARLPKRGLVSFDIRQRELVRLERRCARKVWKQLRKSRRKKR